MPPVLNDRAYEMRLRRLASKKGLVLCKTRRPLMFPWSLTEADSGSFVKKHRSLLEIEHFLRNAA